MSRYRPEYDFDVNKRDTLKYFLTLLGVGASGVIGAAASGVAEERSHREDFERLLLYIMLNAAVNETKLLQEIPDAYPLFWKKSLTDLYESRVPDYLWPSVFGPGTNYPVSNVDLRRRRIALRAEVFSKPLGKEGTVVAAAVNGHAKTADINRLTCMYVKLENRECMFAFNTPDVDPAWQGTVAYGAVPFARSGNPELFIYTPVGFSTVAIPERASSNVPVPVIPIDWNIIGT